MAMSNQEAIKILSILHVGHSLRVKEACDKGIKALLREEESASTENLKTWLSKEEVIKAEQICIVSSGGNRVLFRKVKTDEFGKEISEEA